MQSCTCARRSIDDILHPARASALTPGQSTWPDVKAIYSSTDLRGHSALERSFSDVGIRLKAFRSRIDNSAFVPKTERNLEVPF